MSTIKNERDVIIGNASARTVPSSYNYISLESPNLYFRAATDGTYSPTNIVIEAKLFGILEGTVTFSATGTLFTAEGNTCTINYLDPTTDNFTVTASLVYLGVTYSASISLSIVHDGVVGTSGDSVDIIFTRSVSIPNTPAPSADTPTGWVSTTATLTSDNTKGIWASVGKKIGNSTVYIWQTPYAVEGSTVAEVTIFKRSLTSITDAPTGGSYDFSTKTLTTPSGWSINIPSGTAPVYSSRATAKIFGTSGTDSALTWSVPSISLQDAVVLSLTSSNDIVSCDEYGQQYTLPTGNSLALYSGGTLQQGPTNVIYSGTKTQNGLTVTVNINTGAITLSGASWTTDKETFILSATYGGVQYQTTYNVIKSRAGSSAITADLLRETAVVNANTDGSGYSLPDTNVLSLYKGTVKLVSGVTYAVSGTNPKSGVTASIDSSGNITLSAANNSWTTDSVTFTFKATYDSKDYFADYTVVKARNGNQGQTGASGAPAIIVTLKSDQDVVLSDTTGTTYVLPTGNNLQIYEGSILKTSGVSFSGGATKNGLTLSIDASTGAITLSGTAWNTDSETFDLVATYNSIPYTKTYTIVKVKQGATGANGEPSIYVDLLSESDVCPANNDGTGYTLPTGNYLRMFRGGTQEISNVEYSVTDGISSYIASASAPLLPSTLTVPAKRGASASNLKLAVVWSPSSAQYAYSSDLGNSWTQVTHTTQLYRFAGLPNAIFGIAGTGLSLYKTVNGTTWQLEDTVGGGGGTVLDIVSNGTNAIAVICSAGSSFYLTVLVYDAAGNKLTKLTKMYSGIYGDSVSVAWFDETTIFISRINNPTGIKVPLVNASGIWSFGTDIVTGYSHPLGVYPGSTYATNMQGIAFITGQMISGSDYNLYKSTNGGATWTQVSDPLLNGLSYWVVYSKSNDSFIITTSSGKIYSTGNASTGYSFNSASIVLDISLYSTAGSLYYSVPIVFDGTANMVVSYKSTATTYNTIPVLAGATIVKDGVTVGINSLGAIILSAPNNSWVSDFIQLNFIAKYLPTGQQFTTRYSLAKAKSGNSITDLILSAGESLVAYSNYAGTAYTLPGSSTAQLYTGGTPVTSGATYSIVGGTVATDVNYIYKTLNNLTLTLHRTTGAMTWSTVTGQTWSTNTETFTITATYGNISYNKVLSISKLKAGEATISAQLLSESDVVAANNDGTGYILPTGNAVKVYQGGTEVTTGVTYSGTATKNGLTATISSTGTITLSGTAWTTNQESFTINATYSGITYSKIYTVSKNRAGANAVIIDLDREVAQVVANSDGTGYSLPTSAIVSLYSGGTKLTSGVTFSISGGTLAVPNYTKTQNGLTCTVNTSTGAVSLSGTSWTSTYEEFGIVATYNSISYTAMYKVLKVLKGVDGVSSIALVLKSNNDVISADAYGGSYIYPPTNNAYIYNGGTQVTTGVTYGISGGVVTSGVSSVTKNGLTFSMNTSTGILSYSGSAWSTNQETITVTATYNSITYNSQYTISKALAGTSVINIDLLAENTYVPAENDGTGYTIPVNNQIRLYYGASILTTGVTYGISGGTVSGSTSSLAKNGLTCSVNTTTGVVTFAAPTNSWTTDSETFDLTGTYNSITYTARFTAVKSKKGSSGGTGDSVRIAYTKTTLSTLAATPATLTTTGSSSLPPNDSWGTGTVWVTSPPAITAGQSVWQSNGVYSPATGSIVWATPYLSALRVGKLSALSADLGTITAGNISSATIGIGTNPAVSGTTMSGSGLIINTDGTFAIGNPVTNMSFNGSRLTLNGDIITAANIQQGAVTYINSAYTDGSFTPSTVYNATTYTSALYLDVYCAGGPVMIIPNINTSALSGFLGTKYYAAGANYYSYRTTYFGVAKTLATTTTVTSGDMLRYSNTSTSSIGLTAFDPAPSVGYNRYHIVVIESPLPAGATNIVNGYMGSWFRNIWANQMK